MTRQIGREDLKAAIDSGTVTVVDALPAGYFDKQHLPGALNLVAADVDACAPQLLPDRDAQIVTYCANSACPNSEQVATRLAQLGYTNVAKYAGGIEDWTSAGLPVESTVGV